MNTTVVALRMRASISTGCEFISHRSSNFACMVSVNKPLLAIFCRSPISVVDMAFYSVSCGTWFTCNYVVFNTSLNESLDWFELKAFDGDDKIHANNALMMGIVWEEVEKM